MRALAMAMLAILIMACLIPSSSMALTSYSQDFEGLFQIDPTALGDDGWVVYGNVFSPDGLTWLYGYGVFPAPNDGFAFSQVVFGEGGIDQGAQQLVAFSDYNNVDHATGNLVQSNLFQEQVVTKSDIYRTWTFTFDAKLGNLIAPSTAEAFIKTVDPAIGFATTNYFAEDMTITPADWTSYSISIFIDPALEGKLLQFGFVNSASSYVSSGIFYDNISFEIEPITDAPPILGDRLVELKQNYPNPFNPSTKIEFALSREENVEIAVFDMQGRKVSTLINKKLSSGDHSVIWSGRSDDGSSVASGRYNYTLKTSSGQETRSMILIK